MAVDKNQITDNLWTILDLETTRILEKARSAPLTPEDHLSLANVARVTRTLSLHDPSEKEGVLIENAEDLRAAIELLRKPDAE